MSKSTKRREHDRRKAERLRECAREVLGPEAFSGRPIRCNCENLACDHSTPARNEVEWVRDDPSTHSHCRNPGSIVCRIVDLGTVCPACFLAYPEEYRVNRFDGKTYSHRY